MEGDAPTWNSMYGNGLSPCLFRPRDFADLVLLARPVMIYWYTIVIMVIIISRSNCTIIIVLKIVMVIVMTMLIIMVLILRSDKHHHNNTYDNGHHVYTNKNIPFTISMLLMIIMENIVVKIKIMIAIP